MTQAASLKPPQPPEGGDITGACPLMAQPVEFGAEVIPEEVDVLCCLSYQFLIYHALAV